MMSLRCRHASQGRRTGAMSESLCSRLQFTINRLEECSAKTWARSHGTGRCLLFLPRTSHGGKPERMALCAHEEALGEGLELGKPVILMHYRGHGAVCIDHQALPVDVLPDALPRRDVPVCVNVCMNACMLPMRAYMAGRYRTPDSADRYVSIPDRVDGAVAAWLCEGGHA